MTTSIGEAYFRLIVSDRVGAKTRDALLERAKADAPDYQPVILSISQLNTLRSLLDRILPQQGKPMIDLAARIDQQLSEANGDGWRRAELPCDAQAYASGLDTLNATASAQYQQQFLELDALRQDRILLQIAADDLPQPSGAFSPLQMRLWFEDVRADAVRLYVAHPATLERMGYSGIANGGDGLPKSGFVQIGLSAREDWEPVRKP